MQDVQSAAVRRIAALFVQAIALASLTVFILRFGPAWFQHWYRMDPLERILGLEILINYLIIALALPIYLRHRERSRLLSVAMWVATAIVWLMLLAPYVIGGIQDLLIVRCVGFFGVQTSCIESWQLGTLILSLYPYVVALWTILAVLPLLTIIGAWKAARPFRAS
jgi:hypothetical protein